MAAKHMMRSKAPFGGVYFMGLVAALFYFIKYHSGGFWFVVLAILKALVWPAFIVYHILLLLHA